MGELSEASKAYKEVLKQAPRHLDARLALAAIEQQLGRTESALQALTLGENYNVCKPQLSASSFFFKYFFIVPEPDQFWQLGHLFEMSLGKHLTGYHFCPIIVHQDHYMYP